MSDVYRIGVTIAMVNGVSAVLGVIGRDLMGLNSHVKLTEENLNRMGKAMLGAGMVFAGGAVLAGMKGMVDHAKELVHQQELYRGALKDSGLTGIQIQQELAAATTQAWKTAHDVQTSNVAENLKSIRELRMVFGDTPEAIKNLSSVATAKAVMDAMTGKDSDEQVFAMAKALEIKGVSMDPQHFAVLLDDMVKVAVASGGKVLGTDFQSAFKFGRTATQGWDDNFVATILPTLIQEMKGGGGFSGATGPGNALQSAFQNVVGGVMSNKSAEEYYRLGLLGDDHIIRTSTGNIKGIRPGGIAGASQFQADPYQWTQDVLVPALNKAGITDPDKVREEVSHLFVNRTAQQIITMFATQQQRFLKDQAVIGQAGGLNTLDDLAKRDPNTEIKAFTEAWGNMVTALGTPLAQALYNDYLPKLTHVLQDFTTWAAKPENQQAIKNIELVTAAFAGLLVIGGALTIVSVALGPFTTAFKLLVGALASSETAAAAAGASTLAADIGLVIGALGLVAALPGLAVGAGVLGSKYQTPETQAAQAALDRQRRGLDGGPNGALFDGFDASGRPLSAVPPAAGGASSSNPVPVVITNPGEVGDHIANGVSSGASRPPAGPSGYDTRMSLPPASLGIPQQ